MNGRGHSTAALTAAAIGLLATYVSGGAGTIVFLAGAAVLVLGWGRSRGWKICSVFERPAVFAALGAIYLPVFLFDLVVVSRGQPVLALVRLVVLLLASELLSGTPKNAHRPILFGFLLMMAAAAQTTDIWFGLPLVAFTTASVAALMGFTISRHDPRAGLGHGGLPPRMAGTIVITAGSLLVGATLFFLIPRAGAGWGRAQAVREQMSHLDTGLGHSVDLGAVGRIKLRHRVAYRGRVTRSGSGFSIDPRMIYWRAQAYSRWTGLGWERGRSPGIVRMYLPSGETVHAPPAEETEPSEWVSATVELERVRSGPLTMLTHGRTLWVRSGRDASVLASADGLLYGIRGATPRRYEIAADVTPPDMQVLLLVPATIENEREQPATRTRGRAARHALHQSEAPNETHLAVGTPDPALVSWAEGIAKGEASRLRLARAFVRDLEARPYSLDLRGIDPQRPLGSFIEGVPGHCELFASAMAIGLRMRGVPTRVVGGYLGADPMPLGSGFVIRDSRAHLWVEVFFPGSGWVRFDPTPEEGRDPEPLTLPTLRAVWERAVLAWDGWVIGLDMDGQLSTFLTMRDGLAGWFSGLSGEPMRYVGIALGIGAAVVALSFVLRRRRRSSNVASMRGMPRYFRRLVSLARRRGLGISPGETAAEFADRAGFAIGDEPAARLISRFYERERFGGERPSAPERDGIAEALARLSDAMRRGPSPGPGGSSPTG